MDKLKKEQIKRPLFYSYRKFGNQVKKTAPNKFAGITIGYLGKRLETPIRFLKIFMYYYIFMLLIYGRAYME